MILALLHILCAIAAVYCAAVSVYLFVVTVAAYGLGRGSAIPPGHISCALVIPAHNEAEQIAHTVELASRSEYPSELLQICVIADNCDDNTAAIARLAGATVFERFDTVNRGKGQALDWFFRNHSEVLESHEATVIIDADSEVDVGFLAAITDALFQPDIAAVQSNNRVANPLDHWRTALTSASFALVNCVRPAGLARLGASAGLKGNGMAFRSEILAQYGWPAHSLVEDVEFGVRLLLEGYRTGFAPEAHIRSDMPAGRLQADQQRRRWEFGRFEVARRFIPPLLSATITGGTPRHLGALMELVTPPLSLLVLLEGFFLVLSLFVHPAWTIVFALCAMLMAAHVTLGLRYSRLPGRVWLALLAAPAFLAWKVVLYAGLIATGGQKGWVRTMRDGELRTRAPGKGAGNNKGA